MQLNQISSWKKYDNINNDVQNEFVKSWLLELGPITKRISEKKNFSLELLKDDVGEVEIQDQRFIDSLAKEFKVREVLLYGDKIPLVFARTIIPLLTIEKGLAELGKLGTRPLGDILFEKKIFKKEESAYASFELQQDIFWGRKIKYSVNGQPFSVMEVFFLRMKSKILNFIKLARLDKPIGIYLLLWPSLLGLLLGAISEGYIDFENILIVLVGSVLVRSCGCVINDISDRNFDKVVERTKERPLASGNISLKEAWIFFIILSIASFCLLLLTPLLTLKIALFVSLLIILYPLSKRFLKAPQLILGITFGSGSVISYSLQSESFSLSIIILYFGLVAWIVSFDSFYALEDIDDDKKIGINSTPILWGGKTIFIANALHLIFYASLLLIAGLFAVLGFTAEIFFI